MIDVITADWHFMAAKLGDQLAAVDQIIEYGKKRRPAGSDIRLRLFIAGDIYQSYRPAKSVEIALHKKLMDMREVYSEIWIIPGNHDFKDHLEHAVTEFAILDVNGINVCAFPDTIPGDNYHVVAIPHIPKDIMQRYENTTYADAWLSMLKEQVQHVPEGGKYIIISHPNPPLQEASVPAGVRKVDEADLSAKDILRVTKAIKNSQQKSCIGVVLGDIHTPQTIDDHLPILYTGSLIRSNKSEWDQSKRFVTIDDGVIGSESLKLHPATRFDGTLVDARIFVETMEGMPDTYLTLDCTEQESRSLELHQLIRDAQKKSRKLDYKIKKLGTKEVRDVDISATESPTDAFVSYMDHIHMGASDDVLMLGHEIIDGKHGDVPTLYSDVRDVSPIVEIIISNYRSYGENQRLTFEENEGRPMVNLIVGMINGDPTKSIGSGKSTIIGSIMWCLFGTGPGTRKYPAGDHLIRDFQDYMQVEIVFMDGTTIKRRRTRDKSTKLTVSGKITTCHKIDETEQEIIQYLGMSADTIRHSLWLEQNEFDRFSGLENAVAKEKFMNMLPDANVWPIYRSIAKGQRDVVNDKLKVRMGQLEALETLLGQEVEEDLRKELAEMVLKLRDTGLAVEMAEKEVEEVEADLLDTKKDMQEIKTKIADFNELQSTRECLISDIAGFNVRRQDVSKEIQEWQEAIDSATSTLARLELEHKQEENIDDLKATGQELTVMHDGLLGERSNINKRLVTIENDIGKAQARLRDTEKAQEEECPTCGREGLDDSVFTELLTGRQKILTEAEQTKGDIEVELQSVIDKLSEVETQLREVQFATNAFDKRVVDIENWRRDKGKSEIAVQQARERKVDIEESLATVEAEEAEIGVKVDALADTMADETQMMEEFADKLHTIENKLVAAKSKHSTYVAARRDAEREQGHIEGRLETIEKTREDIEGHRTAIEEAEYLRDIFQELYGVFGPDGIQSYIIENASVAVETIANGFLDYVGRDEQVSIVVREQAKTVKDEAGNLKWMDTFKIIASVNGVERMLEEFSGGEGLWIDISIRLALSIMLINRKAITLPILFMDEGVGNLDEHDRMQLVSLLHMLKEMYGIFIYLITHCDIAEYHHMFDRVTVVNMRHKVSYIDKKGAN